MDMNPEEIAKRRQERQKKRALQKARQRQNCWGHSVSFSIPALRASRREVLHLPAVKRILAECCLLWMKWAIRT